MGLGTGAIIGGVVAGAGAITSGVVESNAANNAANLQQQQFEVQQQTEAPFVNAGTTALGQLSSMPNFTAPTAAEAAAEPGEQFQLDQGELSLNNALTAKGITGGNAAEAMDEFSQGLASTDYAQTYNEDLSTYGTNLGRLQQIAGLGAQAANTTVQASENYATNAGQDIIGAGNAEGAAAVGAGNATSTAIGGYENASLLQQILGNQSPSSYTNGSMGTAGMSESAQAAAANYNLNPTSTISPDQWAAYENP